MKSVGIKLTINDEIYKACMDPGSVHAITIGYEDNIDLYLTGSNAGQKIIWYKSALDKGAIFSMEIVEMEKSSSPLEIKEYTNEELLSRYVLLKQKLEGKI